MFTRRARTVLAIFNGVGFAALFAGLLYGLQGVSMNAVPPVALLTPFLFGAIAAWIVLAYGYVGPALTLGLGVCLALAGWQIRTMLQNELVTVVSGLVILGVVTLGEAGFRGDVSESDRIVVYIGGLAGATYAVAVAPLAPTVFSFTLSQLTTGPTATFGFVLTTTYLVAGLVLPAGLAIAALVRHRVVLPSVLVLLGLLLWAQSGPQAGEIGIPLLSAFWPVTVLLLAGLAALERKLRAVADGLY